MKNQEFYKMTPEQRKKNLGEIIFVKSKGFISEEVILQVLDSVDINRQYSVYVTNDKKSFDQKVNGYHDHNTVINTKYIIGSPFTSVSTQGSQPIVVEVEENRRTKMFGTYSISHICIYLAEKVA